MTGSVNKSCTSCRGISRNGTFTCDDCKPKAFQRRKHWTDRLYNVDWKRLKALLNGCGNVFCQRVREGYRCRNVGKKWHHIIEADVRPELFYEWENLANTCESCHPNPNDSDQGRYVPTLYATPLSDEPVPDIQVAPGHRVPERMKLWSRNERIAHFRDKILKENIDIGVTS